MTLWPTICVSQFANKNSQHEATNLMKKLKKKKNIKKIIQTYSNKRFAEVLNAIKLM